MGNIKLRKNEIKKNIPKFKAQLILCQSFIRLNSTSYLITLPIFKHLFLNDHIIKNLFTVHSHILVLIKKYH